MALRKTMIRLLLVLTAALPAMAQRSETAWEEVLRRNPGAADDGRIGPLERKVLHALSPEQAAAFDAGAPPEQIVLDSGETLADFLAAALAVGPGLAYVPVDQCPLFRTNKQTAPVAGNMAADEIRDFVARGSGTAHSDQGGFAAGCQVPDEAVAIVIHFRVVSELAAGNGFLKAWAADEPEPATVILDYEPDIRRFNTAAVLELCPLGACATGEFKVKTVTLGGKVRGDVVGFFRPLEAADIPGGGGGLDADTLDGLDSGQFLRSDTSDSFTSGTLSTDAGTTLAVAGALDASAATATSLPTAGITGAGSGSGLDADLLDGKDSLELTLQTANCLTVSPSCPAAAPDALASRCWQTISAALGEIGSGLPAAGAANRYLIKVGPGTYTEQVVMKSFVDIEGSGEKVTWITSSDAVATLTGASDAVLRHLTVEHIDGAGNAPAILNLGTSPLIKHVTVLGDAVNVAIANSGGAAPLLVHVTAKGRTGVSNISSDPVLRDSVIEGPAVAALVNGGSATANVVNTQLIGLVDDGATNSTFTCLGAYDATFSELDANCQ